ncbi:hypothetical protein LY90DRAFT_513119 [Neocallimastix californiae]|uniref:Uncharacterized protein n=1 Tax=Neocallimastix californiae TaxID=1754190 RepID=A0A1Y2B399_9FUNG|nr:hypothetical protein LY90DRAFT_513119 [Neocallimastix californiae]|eukprot:ORY28565.1 hypothetical protein LY90DRAFT_513119 [Neocallimastix californiae]
MNPVIPSSHYLLLDKQLSLDTILDNIYNQISIFKNHKLYKSGDINFELEFRLRNKYTDININDFVNCKSCQYHEYLFKENKTTRYRIICESSYPANINDDQDINLETEEENENGKEKKKENIKNEKISKLYKYVDVNSEKEITETLNGKVEFTKKITLMTAYYFIYKIVLSIETNMDVSDIISFLNNSLAETENGNNKKNKSNKVLDILQFITPTIKYRKSYILHKDVRIDVTKYEVKSQFEIDFSRNINHERSDMINIVHDIMLLLDFSNLVLDYLFYLLPNFEFQKPITPSLDTIFDVADDLVKITFFVAAKTDGLRRLVIIINHLMFSISENFEVEYIDCISSDLHLVFDCEFVNDNFIPFDIFYHNVDLRSKSFKEHIAILDSLSYDSFKDKIKRKKIRKCENYSDLQSFIENEINNENKNCVPNDGIIITDGASTYNLQNSIPFDGHRVENTRVYKIKTRNTVDLRFDGRYFYAKQHSIKMSNLKITLAEFKKIYLKYYQHKKLKYDKIKVLHITVKKWIL